MAAVVLLNASGDERIDFDADVQDERQIRARALFDEKVGRGYFAYVPDDQGGGTQIRRFDPRAREIILQPAIAGG